VLLPTVLFAVNFIDQLPNPNVYTGFWLWLNQTSVLFPVTFLKLQFHAVGVLFDVSLNWTGVGAVPLVTLLVKFAVGAAPAALTLMK